LHRKAPSGAQEISPWRKPWESTRPPEEPRRGGRDAVSYAPSGAIPLTLLFPRLTPWANFLRPSGAIHRGVA
jgi:hypothetical protein